MVVLIHGLGADGSDLIDLAPILAERLPDALFIAPDAPFACDMAPFGRQWFSLQSRDPADVASGVLRVAPILMSFLDAMLERHGLASSALALLGFSQGAMMALHAGIHMSPAPAAVVGFSGRFVPTDAAGKAPKSRPPVLLVHGEMDDVVPHAAMPAAARALNALSIQVECCTRPGLGHAIDPEGLQVASQFLARHLLHPA